MTVFSAYSSVVSAYTLLVGRPKQPRLFLLQPEVIFAARVNMATADYPLSFIAYDTVTTGAYTDLKPGMTILLGSAAGFDDYGRQRVRGPVTPATTISIYVGRSSRGTHDGELTIVDNAYITVWDDRRVWAKIPFIDSAGEAFKDSDLEVTDRTTLTPPVANMGQGDARTIDPVTFVTTVSFDGAPSYVTTAGATITTYAWNIADGTLTSGTLSSAAITVTFPAGFRYVRLIVTDSNGKTATTERPVYARDPDNDTSFAGFAMESHRITDAGQTMSIRALEDMPRATYPDGTLAIVWQAEPTGSADRDHILIIGWLDTEDANHNAGRTGLLRDTTITIQDVAARLDTLPGFSQSVADDATRTGNAAVLEKIPDITWNYMVAPTMDKYMHYLLAWHSTALEMTDFYWSGTGTAYRIAVKSSDGESLWNQVSRLGADMLPGYALTCGQSGRLRMMPDPMLQDSADRTAVVQVAITEDYYSAIRFGYQRAPRTHWLRTGALVVQASITFNDDGTVVLPKVFSIAPGDAPGQGLGAVENNEGLVASQVVLNSGTGHKYARMNVPVGMVTVTLIQDDATATTAAPWHEIKPALKEWVTIRLGAAYAAQRGLTFDTVRALPKEVNIRYNQGKAGLTRTVELTAEIETVGVPAATFTPPASIPAVGNQPPPTPPAGFVPILPGDVTYFYGSISNYILWDGAHVFRTANLLAAPPVWELVDTGITGTILDGEYVQTSTTNVGMWLMTSTAIWWCNNILATTPSWSAVLPIATVRASDEQLSGNATVFVSMDQYRSEPGYLIVATAPASNSSAAAWGYQHAYSWHTHDYGLTWTQVDMNAFLETYAGTYISGYSWGGPYCVNVYASSPVVFMVRSAAYAQSKCAVFKSTDGGHTWTKEYAFTNGFGIVGYGPSILAPFPNITSPTYTSKGHQPSGTFSTLGYSNDAWATGTIRSTPAGYLGLELELRPNKHTFEADHVLAYWLRTSDSHNVLLESDDDGVTWAVLFDSGRLSGSVQMPNGWPPNVDVWIDILKSGSPGVAAQVIRYTSNNFVSTTDKTGNIGTLVANWVAGGCNGFALPHV